MHFLVHPISQGLVDELVLLHHALALEQATHDDRLKMMAVTLYLNKLTVEALLDI